MEFVQSSKTIKVKDGKGNTRELKNVDEKVFNKGLNQIFIQMSKSGYIVKVNDVELNEFVTTEQSGSEIGISAGFTKVSILHISKLNGTAKSLYLGTGRNV